MNNIKTYLSNLTKADIENATKEELALIIDYMEQVKGDLDFSALIKDKVEQFKQFATEANNKIILEAALQERQEKHEILRERVRFMRNLDYIEKTVQVQNTREEDSRIQRNIDRLQQQNIQAQVASIMALYEPRFKALAEFAQSETYKNVVEDLKAYAKVNPNIASLSKALIASTEAAINPYKNEEIMKAVASQFGTEIAKQVVEERVTFAERQRENYEKNQGNPDKILKQGVINIATLLENIPEGTEPFVKDIAGVLQEAIEKIYGEKVSPELLKRFKDDFTNGRVTLEDIGKNTAYMKAIVDLSMLEVIQRERKDLQERIKAIEQKGELVPEHLKLNFFQSMYKEIGLKATAENIEKAKGDSTFTIVLKDHNSELTTVTVKSSDSGMAIRDFADSLLKTGMADVIANFGKDDVKAINSFLNHFTYKETKFTITDEKEGKEREFSELNSVYSKLSALITLKQDNLTDSQLILMLDPHIEKMKKEVIKAYQESHNMAYEDAEKFVSRLTPEDLKQFNAYKAYEHYQLNSMAMKPSKQETEQGMLDRLVKEGMSLGEIKERYPQLDKLVAKEHEAVAFNQENANEQTKEQVAENTLNKENIEMGI